MNLDVSEIYSSIISDIQSRVPVPFATNHNNLQTVSSENENSKETQSFQTVLDSCIDTYLKTGNVSNSNPNIKYGNITPEEITSAIETAIKNASAKYNIDESLIKAVIQQESSFNPTSVSSSGAQGLMQLMPATADYLGPVNCQIFHLFNRNQNLGILCQISQF